MYIIRCRRFMTKNDNELKIIGGRKMFCNKCGGQMADDAKFCTKCGQPVGESVQGTIAQPVVQQATPQGTVIIQKSGGGAFQKIMMVFILLIFLVIMFVVLSFYMDNKNEKALQKQQDQLAAQAQEDWNELWLNYEQYQGTWTVERVFVDGEWQSYDSFWGELAGAYMDFRNYYYFGNDTDYNTATTVQFTSSGFDLTNIGLGSYDLKNFVYSTTTFDEDIFTNEAQGIQIKWRNVMPEPYLEIYQRADNGEWIGAYILEKSY